MQPALNFTLRSQLFLITFLLWLPGRTISQSVSIGLEEADAANPAAVLNIYSTNKGLLIPRMTSSQRNAIASPANGLMVYDTNRHAFFYYNEREGWIEMKPVPSGTITMWYGNPAVSFPGGVGVGVMKGWALCNGGSRPDLTGRFVVGSGSQGVSGTGGEALHTLTESEMPAHSHGISDPGHTHTASLGSTFHTHVVQYQSGSTHPNNAQAEDGSDITYSGGGTVNHNVTTGETTFNKSILAGSAGISLNSTGGGQAHENRPPYYVLAYIIKL